MKKALFVLMIVFCSVSFCNAQKKDRPVAVIFDTDIGPDYDDVGAITLLHAFADSGEASILATMASNKYAGIAAVLNVFNTYFGRPDIPIGVPKGNAVDIRDGQHWTDTIIAKYPHKIQSNNEAADPTALYRKILSQQPDGSVTIITVGFLTNLANLLHSQPDGYSSLDGIALVRKKVKLLVSMAAIFTGDKTFKEFNLKEDVVASKTVCEHWPTKIIFSGFEIGAAIKTGVPLVQNNAIQNSPVKDVFRICLPMAEEDHHGRKSWDETAVLVAVKGNAQWFELKEGKIIVNDDGSNGWDSNAKGQFYLVQKSLPVVVQQTIDALMQHQPLNK